MNSFRHEVNGKARPARRVTDGALGHNYGADRGRRLVVTLAPGDVITFRPQGTTRPIGMSAFDLYRYAVQCYALKVARRTKDLKQIMTLAKARKQAAREGLAK